MGEAVIPCLDFGDSREARSAGLRGGGLRFGGDLEKQWKTRITPEHGSWDKGAHDPTDALWHSSHRPALG